MIKGLKEGFEFQTDAEAWDYLKSKAYTEERFLIRRPHPDHEPTEKEWDALDYLTKEWDWDYEPGKLT